MVLFIILGMVVLIAIVVLGVLFFMLSKEGQTKDDEKAVPLRDLTHINKEFSSSTLGASDKGTEDDQDVIPAFVPKVALPTQEVKAPLEDDTYKKRSLELEEELRAITKKAEEQSDVAREMILTLTKENQTLKNQQSDLEEAQAKLSAFEGEVNGLKTENTNLQTQLDETTSKVRLLEEEKAALKIQMTEEIAQVNATIAQMKQEKEAIAPPAAEEKQDEILIQLKQKYEDLERSSKELTEKNEQLQYELVKAKAQASGLERVSFNYKNQLEDFLKKVNTVQATNDDLSQTKNKLEGVVDEIKNQNEDLVKKDQLAQFELEQNRTRLVTLERECEELKAKLSTSGGAS